MAEVSVIKPKLNLTKKKKRYEKDTKFALKILIPALVVFLFGIFFPLIIGIFISFTDSSATAGYFGTKISILNYYELLFYGGRNTKYFWQYTYQTLFFSIVAVFFELFLGIVFALLLNKKFWGRGLARATLLIPWALPTVASATIFRYEFFAPLSDYGVFNSIIHALSGREVAFYGADVQTLFTLILPVPYSPYLLDVDITFTMICCIFIDVWKTTPYFSLLILAALQIVPDDLYKAADIAGANNWQKFWKITWPMIRPGVGIALVFRMMDAIRVYDAIVVFRDTSVYSMTYQAVNFWAKSQEFGMASAVAILEFVLIATFALIIFKWASKERKPKKHKIWKILRKKIKLQLNRINIGVFKKEKKITKKKLHLINRSKSDDLILTEKEEALTSKITLKKGVLKRFNRRRAIERWGFRLAIIFMILFCSAPFIWIVGRSFRNPYIPQMSFEFFPKYFSIKAFKVVFETSGFTGVSFGRALVNGFILSSTTGVIVLIIGSLTGYALAKFKFPGKMLSTGIIFTMTSLPALIIIIPYFIQVKTIAEIFPFMDLTDNLLGLLLPYTAFNLPIATFVLRSFFQEIPEDLWKAAKVDGASNFQIFYKVIAPLVIPGLFTCFILVFINAWNELLFAQIWLVSDVNHTVPRAILRFVQSPLSLSADWDTDIALMAATSLATVPLVIIVLIFQKQIIKGITSGAVKG
ncbi:MAG: ABC transporter permease subunit [Candidatus Lokiarchaeota archaeon]|nr:ABC transporter permease subunit [Candidatus Harpocratesius repetitus]